MEIFCSVEFWKFAAPLFGAVIAWFINEWRKRIWEQYTRKEERYKKLLGCMKGFYIDAENAKELKAEFLNQLNQCWLYCPDEVIKKGYIFLETIQTNSKSPDEAKEKVMGDFIVEIRKDLLSRKLVRDTSLSSNDFKHLKAT